MLRLSVRFRPVRRCLMLLAALFFVRAATAVDVALQWDESEEPVLGYRVYCALDSSFSDARILSVTNTMAVVKDLYPGATYHFAVTAFDAEGESDLSDLLVVRTAGLAPIRLKSFEGQPVSFNFRDAFPSLSRLAVSILGAPWNGFLSVEGTELTYTPDAGFSGTDRITYSLMIGARTQIGVIVIDVAPVSNPGDGDPTAPAAPVISNLRPISDDARTISIAWETDQDASCEIEYGLGQALRLADVTSTGRSHAVTLNNLLPGTIYTIRVSATAETGTMTQSILAATPKVNGFLFSAEDGELAGSMAVWSGASAQNRQFIASSMGGSGTATFRLDVERGLNYRIWARVKTPAGGGMISASLDGNDEKSWFVADEGAIHQWHWVLLKDTSDGMSSAILPMDKRMHELVLRAQTANLMVDEVALSNDPNWKPILFTDSPSLGAARSAPGEVTLYWSDSSGNAEGIALEYSTDGVNFELFYFVNVDQTWLPVGSLQPGVRYYFRIFAYNDVERTAYSNVTDATP